MLAWMRLHRTATRRYKGQTYYKWVLTPPSGLVEELGWQDGLELEAKAEDGALVVKPRQAPPPKNRQANGPTGRPKPRRGESPR